MLYSQVGYVHDTVIFSRRVCKLNPDHLQDANNNSSSTNHGSGKRKASTSLGNAVVTLDESITNSEVCIQLQLFVI